MIRVSSASRKHPNRCFKYITDLNNLLHWYLSRNPLQLFGRKTGIYIKRAAYNHRNSYNKKSNHLSLGQTCSLPFYTTQSNLCLYTMQLCHSVLQCYSSHHPGQRCVVILKDHLPSTSQTLCMTVWFTWTAK